MWIICDNELTIISTINWIVTSLSEFDPDLGKIYLFQFAPPCTSPCTLSRAYSPSSSREEGTCASCREGARPRANSYPSRAKGASSSTSAPRWKSTCTCSDHREGSYTCSCSRGKEVVVMGAHILRFVIT